MFQRQIEHTQKRNQRVLEALSPFLTYEQREALQKEQEAELKMQEAQMRIMRAQSTADPTNNNGFVGNSVQTYILPDQRARGHGNERVSQPLSNIGATYGLQRLRPRSCVTWLVGHW